MRPNVAFTIFRSSFGDLPIRLSTTHPWNPTFRRPYFSSSKPFLRNLRNPETLNLLLLYPTCLPLRGLRSPRSQLGSSLSCWVRGLSSSTTSLRNYRFDDIKLSSRNFSKTDSSVGSGSPPAGSPSSPKPSGSLTRVAEKVVFDPKRDDAEEYYSRLERMMGVKQKTETDSKVEKLTLWGRFKDMYKKYWYVLIPVHAVLCVTWYGLFYFLAYRGFDIIPILEKLGVPEKIVSPLRKTGAGYVATAFAIYKLASPLRYSATLGVTTVAINYLKKAGYIKPAPTAARMKQMINERRQRLQILSKRFSRRPKKVADREKREAFVTPEKSKTKINGSSKLNKPDS